MCHKNPIVCPICNDDHLMLKYEATYEYSYMIDSNAPGLNNTRELLPYIYDNREQKDAKQYIECTTCGTTYPCYFDKWTEGLNFKMIQKAIDSTHIPKPKHK